MTALRPDAYREAYAAWLRNGRRGPAPMRQSPPLAPQVPEREGLVTAADLMTKFGGSVNARARKGHSLGDWRREQATADQPAVEDGPPPPIGQCPFVDPGGGNSNNL